MQLAELTIKNFKGLRDAAFQPSSFTCLVGENNAGKSSVLQAVVYLLNRPAQLPASLFYNAALPVVLRGRFTGVDDRALRRLVDAHRLKLQGLVDAESLEIVLEYRVGEKLEIKVLRRSPVDARYTDDAIDEAFKGKRGAAVLAVVDAEYPEFREGFPEGVTLIEAKAHLAGKIRQLPPTRFHMVEGPLPSGISSSITELLPEAIYIPAVKNLNDDLKTSQSTSFGRLLGLLLDDLTPDLEQIQSALLQLNQLLNRTEEAGVVTDARHEKVQSLERLVEGLLAESFPRVRIELEVPPPELRAILNTAQIYVNDGAKDLIDNKGDGIKRCMTFALLRAYVSKLQERATQAAAGASERPLFFLFEEPELFLHPKSQRILFGALAAISANHQVAVTTHSPLFFAPGITAVFVRVAKQNATPKPIGVLNPVNFALDNEKAEVFRLARFENVEAGFFSSRVVLIEGESDDAFFCRVARILSADWDFDSRNISFVRVAGKGNFARFRSFFEAFGIDVKIIADLDVLVDGFSHLGAGEECTRLRSNALEIIDRRVREAAIAPEISAQRVKSKINTDSWKGRYEAAKSAILRTESGQSLTAEDKSSIEGLFLWEADESRLRAIEQDPESKAAVVPLLEAMRRKGICVLSRGAVEAYYPTHLEFTGPKPQRALRAAAAVATREIAQQLCPPMREGEPTELEMIFAELFRESEIAPPT